MAPKTVLITGGAGFLGSHLCDLLVQKGDKVICLDNLLTGKKENVSHLFGQAGFAFIKHDIIKPLKIKGPIDYVLHFASPASPKDYEQYPLETLKAGSLGTLNALNIAREKNAVLVMASTSEVYGDPLISPQKESYYGNVNPIGPRSCYDEAKRFSEALISGFQRTYGLDCRIVRIFNTYGPRMRLNDGRVVTNFIRQAMNGEALTLYGNGRQTRSFCYVSDLVRGIYSLMTVKKTKLSGRLVINLGNAHEFRIIDLARGVARALKSDGQFKYLPLPQDDPKQRRPDIKLARQILRWQPRVELQAGLIKTINWFAAAQANR